MKWKGIKTNAKFMILGGIRYREERQRKNSASLNQPVIDMWIISPKIKPDLRRNTNKHGGYFSKSKSVSTCHCPWVEDMHWGGRHILLSSTETAVCWSIWIMHSFENILYVLWYKYWQGLLVSVTTNCLDCLQDGT